MARTNVFANFCINYIHGAVINRIPDEANTYFEIKTFEKKKIYIRVSVKI